MSRHFILVLSVAASLLLHGAFFVMAPRVQMFSQPPLPRPMLDQYRIKLELRTRPETEAYPEPKGPDLATRPGSVSDLLKRETENIALEDPAMMEPAPVPNLEERVAAEELPREYELSQDSNIAERIDSRILEISEKTARKNIQVARRLVRPSPGRIVPEDVQPVLRSQLEAAGDGFLSIIEPPRDTTPPPLEEVDFDAPPRVERPPYEGDILPAEAPVVTEKSAAPIEEVVARAPIERQVQQAKEERNFGALDDLVSFKLDAYAPPGSREGYFRLQIMPKEDAKIETLPKDVTFVIDASKSISQHKLSTTAAGLSASITQLHPEDRFNIVVFRDSPTFFSPSIVQATPDNIALARNFVLNLNSEGETDVYKSILPVVQQTPRDGAPGVVVVISDGRPTKGMRDGRIIINGLTADNDLRNSIFAFGGGRTVNRYLLDLLAYRNKGEAYVVDDIESINTALPTFFQRLESPLLIDLHADYGRVDKSEVFPQIVPDFYRGRSVTVYGRFDPRKDKDFAVRLTGEAGSQRKELIFRADLREAESGDRSIARNWAFEKSYYLIGQMVSQGETPELLRELNAIGTEYNIRTSYSE